MAAREDPSDPATIASAGGLNRWSRNAKDRTLGILLPDQQFTMRVTSHTFSRSGNVQCNFGHVNSFRPCLPDGRLHSLTIARGLRIVFQ